MCDVSFRDSGSTVIKILHNASIYFHKFSGLIKRQQEKWAELGLKIMGEEE